MYKRHSLARLVFIVLSLASPVLLPPSDTLAQTSSLLRDGDRVVLVGGTFIERMQTHGYLETETATRLHAKNLTFRNLGWSGDNVLGESRAVFGSIDDGYARLMRDLKLASPSVVILHYGVVEARQGPAGVAAFQSGLLRIAEDIAKLDSRLILLLPRPQREMGPPFPAADSFNRSLALYRDATWEVSRVSSAMVVDLDETGRTRLPRSTPEPEPPTKSRTPFRQGLSLDGLQLTADGYWLQANSLATALAGPRQEIQVMHDISTGTITATGAAVELIAEDGGVIKMKFQAVALPRSAPPGLKIGRPAPRQMTLTVKGLPPGRYVVTLDGTAAGDTSYSPRQFGSGVFVPIAAVEQVADLQQAIARKNELFFHRYRPQNETYLFLFRKHEQGNNAVEIPMFDPLVESLDREIHRLARPPVRQITIRRRPSR